MLNLSFTKRRAPPNTRRRELSPWNAFVDFNLLNLLSMADKRKKTFIIKTRFIIRGQERKHNL
jgi:hypothetical protein